MLRRFGPPALVALGLLILIASVAYALYN